MKKQFLQLLKDARLNQQSQSMQLDYITLYQLSMQHQVAALIYNQIYKFEDFPLELKQHWKSEALKTNAFQTMKTDKFLRIYKKLMDNDLKVIVVKGLICRSLYPQPDNRPSNDEDLYIEKQYLSIAKDIIVNEGLIVVDESDTVTTFIDRISGLSIELHTALFSKDSKAYGQYQESFDHAFDNVIVHNIMNQEIYSLSYDLHLLFLLMHFIKHFLHGGVGIRQILDIIMYSEAYGNKIHWDDIYNTLEELHVFTLVLNVFALAHDYLEFNYDSIVLPKTFNHSDYDYEDLLDDIIDAGIFGDSSRERKHSSTMTLNATATGKTSVLKSVFPSAKDISGRYPYLKKHPYLLPIAWCNRIYHYITNKNEGDSQKTIEIGNQRIELLKKYKVIK